jgi:hypothetical protein
MVAEQNNDNRERLQVHGKLYAINNVQLNEK